ncbi:MAG: hypothetical protein ACI4EF_03880 [Coprococcus sp.]
MDNNFNNGFDDSLLTSYSNQNMGDSDNTYGAQNVGYDKDTFDNQNMYYNQNEYPVQNDYGQQSYQNEYNMQPPYHGQKIYDPGRNKGIASMVLGICSIVLCWVYGIIGFICGIIGIVLSKKSTDANSGVKNSFATAGNICSIIGMILSGLMLLYIVFVVWLFSKYMGYLW